MQIFSCIVGFKNHFYYLKIALKKVSIDCAIAIVYILASFLFDIIAHKDTYVTVKTMDNVRGHFAAFVAFKTKNQCHIIIYFLKLYNFG